MVHGPRSIGLKFKNYLSLALDAWCLALGACSFYELVCVLGMKIFRLAAWRLDLGPVAVSRGPRFMDLGY